MELRNSSLLWALLLCGAASAQPTINTALNDNFRTGWNQQETVLTPTNVGSASFHKLGIYGVDGNLYAQLLYIPNVTISSVKHNLLIAATMHCSLYAFDADNPGSTYLWRNNFCTSQTSYPGQFTGDTLTYGLEIGCMATPYVDVTNSWIFTVCVDSTHAWTVRKHSLTTGAVITATVISGSNGGTTFSAAQSLARPAIAGANSNIYISFGGYFDNPPWNGWMISYDEATLTQQAIWCTTGAGSGGSIWMSGGGPLIDAGGNLIVTTGNGDWNGTTQFSESFIKLSSSLSVSDFYTPSNYATLSANDWDFTMNMIGIPGTTTVFTGQKNFDVYALDSTSMGHLGGTASIFATGAGTPTDTTGIYSGALANGSAYFPNTNGSIYRFTYSGSTISTTPAQISAATYPYPGAKMSISSNGASNTIVWALVPSGNALSSAQSGTLLALNASTLAPIWSSATVAGDALGNLAKFNPPTIANGKVYTPTFSNVIVVYGLVPSTQITGQVQLTGQVQIQ